uniref:Uncharacterized protein P0406D01.112 n=1 Tax=Oryza sativa subsp. japonica TaxID=39947 RepID=Q6Z088_ORYSJ|nr:hypothetical protein [Oryza sativa Japonica Group]
MGSGVERGEMCGEERDEVSRAPIHPIPTRTTRRLERLTHRRLIPSHVDKLRVHDSARAFANVRGTRRPATRLTAEMSQSAFLLPVAQCRGSSIGSRRASVAAVEAEVEVEAASPLPHLLLARATVMAGGAFPPPIHSSSARRRSAPSAPPTHRPLLVRLKKREMKSTKTQKRKEKREEEEERTSRVRSLPAREVA